MSRSCNRDGNGRGERKREVGAARQTAQGLDSATAQKLDDMLELRDQVEQLQAADPPKGFGRD